jgi:hypothetical protein
MVASILPFPLPHSLLLLAAENGKAEAPFAFVQRMCFEASRHIEESPSAAAIFLEAAARRLYQEALDRASPSSREVPMTQKPTDTDAELIACGRELAQLRQDAETVSEGTPREAVWAACDRIKARIMDTTPRTLAGAAVQLRLVVDPVIGIEAGSAERDVAVLRNILDLVERQSQASADPALALCEEWWARHREMMAIDAHPDGNAPFGSPENVRHEEELTAAVHRRHEVFEKLLAAPPTTLKGVAAMVEVCAVYFVGSEVAMPGEEQPWELGIVAAVRNFRRWNDDGTPRGE